MDDLTYDNIIDKFLEAFPELKVTADQEIKWWHGEPDEDPLPHIFFSNVLHPILIKELATDSDTQFLRRVFEFIEKMATSSDTEVRGLLTAGTLEVLGDDKKILLHARSLMGAKTLLASHEIEISWGRE